LTHSFPTSRRDPTALQRTGRLLRKRQDPLPRPLRRRPPRLAALRQRRTTTGPAALGHQRHLLLLAAPFPGGRSARGAPAIRRVSDRPRQLPGTRRLPAARPEPQSQEDPDLDAISHHPGPHLPSSVHEVPVPALPTSLLQCGVCAHLFGPVRYRIK